jgi:hypothetical protein
MRFRRFLGSEDPLKLNFQDLTPLNNVAFGGAWGGQQGIDDSTLPQSMAVDYVRVYARR